MTAAFADTSYFLALLIPNDVHHQRALQWAQTNRLPLITSEYALLEVGNYLSPVPTRGLLGRFWQTIYAGGNITVVPASFALMESGREIYESHADTPWSLTDCISFMIMKNNSLRDGLTADHHFEQAGFNALLRQP